MTAVLTDWLPAVSAAAAAGAVFRQYVLRPYLAARRVREEADRARVDRLYEEMGETRRELHLLCQAIFALRMDMGRHFPEHGERKPVWTEKS